MPTLPRVPAAGLLYALLACSSVHSTVQVITVPPSVGTHGEGHHGPVAVYYALPPPFRYTPLGDIHVVGSGVEAHLDDLLPEALARAARLDADAVIIQDLRTDARYLQQSVWRTCTTYGPGGQTPGGTCPGQVSVLSVESRLDATAVRRAAPDAPGATPWQPPPPLGAVGVTRPPPPPPAPPPTQWFFDPDEPVVPAY